MTTLRAGIIGLSWIAADPPGPATDPVLGTAPPYSHASAMAAIGGIDVVAACDVTASAVDRFRSQWGQRWPDVTYYDDGLELLASEDLDLVSVVTPDHLHAPFVTAAAERGVSMIFCDKPLATSIDDAAQMLECVVTSGSTLAVNHTHRWDPGIVAARSLVDQGDLGALAQVIITTGGPRAMLFRNLSHALDTAAFLAGTAAEWVIAELEHGSPEYGTVYRGDGGRDPALDPGAIINIGFQDGVRGYVSGLKAAPGDRSIEVLCEEGRIVIDPLGARVIRTPRSNDGTPGSVTGPTISPLRVVSTLTGMQAGLRDLIAAHQEGREPTSSVYSAFQTVALLDATLRSSAKGQERVAVRKPDRVRAQTAEDPPHAL